ncbi:two-component system, response regulator RegA [Marinospirillum celere]|uniref:Two-component system, response regulator RegA n=1 Tax=Marinospirillum celere TaxID=1122252 RepID=A0A1I1E5W0_9GAMM|nr:response regulator transcription factor [Marinospirillum celere]SFB82609.1 two-component system, response regulator RegA [Marinospirillum celere]
MSSEAPVEESLRILVIDDDEVFGQVLDRAFSKRGYEVTVVQDEHQALEKSRDFEPDYITLDLKLEGSSGLNLLPQLIEASPQSKIVVLTGYSSIATAVEAIKLGAVNYLCKPADADEILAAFQKQEGNPDTPLAEQPMSVNRLTWEHIQKVLHEHEGNISATARALGMHRRTLQRKLQKRPVRR